jgi:hypothetical protein
LFFLALAFSDCPSPRPNCRPVVRTPCTPWRVLGKTGKISEPDECPKGMHNFKQGP